MLLLVLCISAQAMELASSERGTANLADVLRSMMRSNSASDGPEALGQLLGTAVQSMCSTECEVLATATSFVATLGLEQLVPPAATALVDLHQSPPRPKRQRIDDNDEAAAAQLLSNLRSFVTDKLATRGPRPTALQAKANVLAEALVSDDLNVAAAIRLTGLSRNELSKGKNAAKDNAERGRHEQTLLPERAVRKDAVDLDWVWEWFHTHCPNVEPDKSRKFAYSKKRAKVAGKVRDLVCELRILKAPRFEVVEDFLNSPEYANFVKETGLSLHPKTVLKCICPCMKEDKRHECACPICTSMHHRLDAWNKQRSGWHSDDAPCSCGLDCSNSSSAWRQASRGFGAFMDAVACRRQSHPGLELPHAPDSPPLLRCVECCTMPSARGHHPAHVTPCTCCGWDVKFGGGCPAEQTEDECVWKRPTEVDAGNGRTEVRYVEHTGTRNGLLNEIREATPQFLYHQWVREFTKWQFKLDIATFNPHEIVILTDFAAIYEMKGHDVANSEHGISCNQLVALVLHSPAPRATEAGPEREVVCDYWRVWGNQKGDANYHQSVVRQIARHYKSTLPDLRRVKIWSDGQRAQYKGRMNFGRMVDWPNAGDMGLEIWHSFFVSHHGPGPQDNAGKDPRMAMDRHVVHEKKGNVATSEVDAYSYSACLRWCREHMTKPSEDNAHRGTFGCNGNYYWDGRSNGTDANPHGVPVLDMRPVDFGPVPGSNELYSFRAYNPVATEPELEVAFVPCHCREHQAGNPGGCPYSNITGPPGLVFVRPKAVAPPRRSHRRRGGPPRDSDNSDDD